MYIMQVRLITLKKYKWLQKSISHARTMWPISSNPLCVVRVSHRNINHRYGDIILQRFWNIRSTGAARAGEEDMRSKNSRNNENSDLLKTSDSKVDIGVGEIMCSMHICSCFSWFLLLSLYPWRVLARVGGAVTEQWHPHLLWWSTNTRCSRQWQCIDKQDSAGEDQDQDLTSLDVDLGGSKETCIGVQIHIRKLTSI